RFAHGGAQPFRLRSFDVRKFRSQAASAFVSFGVWPLRSLLSRAHRLLCWFARELQRSLPVRTDDDRIAVHELALEDGHGERVLNESLDRPLEGTCPEGRVVPFLGQHALRLWRHLERDLSLGEQLLETRELQIDDALDLLGAEWVEDDD